MRSLLTAIAALAIATPAWAANNETARPPTVMLYVSDGAALSPAARIKNPSGLKQSLIDLFPKYPECKGVRVIKGGKYVERDDPSDVWLSVNWIVASYPTGILLQYGIMEREASTVNFFASETLDTPIRLACLAAKAIHHDAEGK